MKGYYKPTDNRRISEYSSVYECNHKLYNECTLFRIGAFGLAVIQERFNPRTKMHFWSAIDPWIADDIYEAPKFSEVFNRLCTEKGKNGLYRTIEVRTLMHLVGLKPMKKRYWERPYDPQILQGF